MGGTSLHVVNCYMHECETGYRLKGYRYSTMTACAADTCTLSGYNFDNTTLTMNGCGTEGCNRSIRADNASYIIANSFNIGAGTTSSPAYGVVESETHSRVIINGLYLRDDNVIALARTFGAKESSYIELNQTRGGGTFDPIGTPGDLPIVFEDSTSYVKISPARTKFDGYSGTTTGAGQLTITHGLKVKAPETVMAVVHSANVVNWVIGSTTATQFTLQFTDLAGSALASTAVQGTYWVQLDDY